jgi:hypothetical protein
MMTPRGEAGCRPWAQQTTGTPPGATGSVMYWLPRHRQAFQEEEKARPAEEAWRLVVYMSDSGRKLAKTTEHGSRERQAQGLPGRT